MVDPHAGDPVEPQLPRRLKPHLAVDHLVATANEDRLTEAKGADRSSDFTHVGRVETSKLSLCRPKLAQRHI
jgi:hypothetical protein